MLSQFHLRVRGHAPAIILWRSVALALMIALAVGPLPAKEKEKDATQYGAGLTINLPFPVSEVVQVVQDVAQNGIIRGTKEYNKDEYISGAVSADSTKVFPEASEGGGKVFYKVRLKALDPRNFKDSGDLGTLAVRYIVQAQGQKNTVLRIDARFVEDFRRTSHPSNGSVESAECKDIHDQLDAIELAKSQGAETGKEELQKGMAQSQASITDVAVVPATDATTNGAASAPMDNTQPPPQTLEARVKALRQQVERRVKAPGAPLKSAPFHSATNLQSLPAGAEVLIVVSTPYWFGVETHDGQHGWMLRDELEFVP